MIINEKNSNETTHDYVLRVISENIVNLELKPGSMISEQEVAKSLSLSRTPIHGALQELAKTKIVEILPQKGCLVSLIDMNLVEESCFIRKAIESAVTVLACENASKEDIESLEENIVLLEFYCNKKNFEKFMEYDNAFHQAMYKIADRALCYYTVQLMNIHHNRFRTLRMHISNTGRIVEEHIAILEAMKKKDTELTLKEYQNHINRMSEDAKEIQEKYPEYFKH